MNYSLFIGRFQPFHKGHLSVIKDILSKGENLIIGIGSAEENYLPENPFTAGERYEMICNTLQAESIDLSQTAIIPIRNINNYALWVRHIELYLPKFNKVYTGSKIVKNLFEQEGKYEVCGVDKKLEIDATLIRQKILAGKNWEDLVPKKVRDYLISTKGDKRIQDINKPLG